jgi:drug/metabolite transporter (DMT)-like permease
MPTSHGLSNRRAYLSLALGVFGIGWSAILVRWAGTSGMVSAFYRLFFATLVFLPWWVLSYITHAPNATLLGVNAPIFVAFGAWVMYGERPTARFWIGFLLAFGGMVAIVGTDVLIHPSLGYGDLLAVGGALCYGVYLLYVQRSRTTMDTLTFSVWAAGTGALCLLPVCLLTGQQLGGFSERTWASLIALTLATQVIGHLLVAHSMGRLPATASSIVLLAQAPLTAILAWPLLGERIRTGQVIGGALVLAGIMVVNVNRMKSAPLRAAPSPPAPS